MPWENDAEENEIEGASDFVFTASFPPGSQPRFWRGHSANARVIQRWFKQHQQYDPHDLQIECLVCRARLGFVNHPRTPNFRGHEPTCPHSRAGGGGNSQGSTTATSTVPTKFVLPSPRTGSRQLPPGNHDARQHERADPGNQEVLTYSIQPLCDLYVTRQYDDMRLRIPDASSNTYGEAFRRLLARDRPPIPVSEHRIWFGQVVKVWRCQNDYLLELESKPFPGAWHGYFYLPSSCLTTPAGRELKRVIEEANLGTVYVYGQRRVVRFGEQEVRWVTLPHTAGFALNRARAEHIPFEVSPDSVIPFLTRKYGNVDQDVMFALIIEVLRSIDWKRPVDT